MAQRIGRWIGAFKGDPGGLVVKPVRDAIVISSNGKIDGVGSHFAVVGCGGIECDAFEVAVVGDNAEIDHVAGEDLVGRAGGDHEHAGGRFISDVVAQPGEGVVAAFEISVELEAVRRVGRGGVIQVIADGADVAFLAGSLRGGRLGGEEKKSVAIRFGGHARKGDVSSAAGIGIDEEIFKIGYAIGCGCGGGCRGGAGSRRCGGWSGVRFGADIWRWNHGLQVAGDDEESGAGFAEGIDALLGFGPGLGGAIDHGEHEEDKAAENGH